MTMNATAQTHRRWPGLIACIAIFLIALAGDLALKAWSFQRVAGQPVVMPDRPGEDVHIPAHDDWTLVAGVLSLKLTVNHGAVFGMGQGGRWFFMAVTLVAAVVIVVLFVRAQRSDRLLRAALALIMGGALGNLYDRARWGFVRDMLYLFPDVHLPFGLRWPDGSRELYPWIFNLADAALVVGIGMILLNMYLKARAEKRRDGPSPS
jgi:signal peptidase II